MQVYLLMDDHENLYRVSTNKDNVYKNERDNLKVVEIDLKEVDEIIEEHYSKYICFCKICYDGEDYWFNAHDSGAAVVELYLMLGRPEAFVSKVKSIYEYCIGEDSLEEDVVFRYWSENFEKPKIYHLSVLVENVLKCLNDWNRDLCALAISSIPGDIATEEELKAYQAYLNSREKVGNFSETSLETIKGITLHTIGYFAFVEPNDMSYGFSTFLWYCTMKITDKTEYLFWAFTYESCKAQTRLLYLLYQCITENLFSSMAEEYRKKRPYFKDWMKPWNKED